MLAGERVSLGRLGDQGKVVSIRGQGIEGTDDGPSGRGGIRDGG